MEPYGGRAGEPLADADALAAVERTLEHAVPDAPELRTAIERYARRAADAGMAPERVLASLGELLRTQARRRAGNEASARLRAAVMRWAIEAYYAPRRPADAPRAGVPYLRFGPNTPAIGAFLRALAALSFADLGRAVARWRAIAGGDAWHRAEDAVARAIADTRRHDEQRRVLEPLYSVFRRATWFSACEPGTLIPGSDASAQYVATIAVFTLLVRDRLDPEAFQLLYEPFAEVVPLRSIDGDPDDAPPAPPSVA
jgi:hypothetical protein